jgi:hypothetical protein
MLGLSMIAAPRIGLHTVAVQSFGEMAEWSKAHPC